MDHDFVSLKENSWLVTFEDKVSTICGRGVPISAFFLQLISLFLMGWLLLSEFCSETFHMLTKEMSHRKGLFKEKKLFFFGWFFPLAANPLTIIFRFVALAATWGETLAGQTNWHVGAGWVPMIRLIQFDVILKYWSDSCAQDLSYISLLRFKYMYVVAVLY